jgi:uncharacterized membrane protein YgcG
MTVEQAKTGSLREPATTVFHNWSVGDKQKENGVLLLLALMQRRIEIITGTGVTHEPLSKAWLENMQASEMTPLLKQQRYDKALVAAVFAIDAQLRSRRDFSGRTSSTVTSPVEGTEKWLERFLKILFRLLTLVLIVTMVTYILKFLYKSTRPLNCSRCEKETKKITLLSEEVQQMEASVRKMSESETAQRLLPITFDDESKKVLISPCLLPELKAGSQTCINYYCSDCCICHVRLEKLGDFHKCLRCTCTTSLHSTITVQSPSENNSGTELIRDQCVNCAFDRSYTSVISALPLQNSSSSYSFSRNSSSSSSNGDVSDTKTAGGSGSSW